MAVFQVDSNAVLEATQTAQGTLEQLRTQAAQLTTTLTALQSSWSGQAAGAFQQVLTNWAATQRSIEQQMGEIQRVLGLAAQYYQESEQQNYTMFAGL